MSVCVMPADFKPSLAGVTDLIVSISYFEFHIILKTCFVSRGGSLSIYIEVLYPFLNVCGFVGYIQFLMFLRVSVQC